MEQPEECLPRPPLSRDLSREGLAPALEEGSSSFSVPAKPPSRYARTDAAQFYESLPVEEPDVHHRGKWYAIRRGRKIGVFSSWQKCEPLVKGFFQAEYKSFWTLTEAREYCLEGKRRDFAAAAARKHCRMQLSSFVGGQSLRALVDVRHEGCQDEMQVLACLDSGADVNMALRTCCMMFI